MTTSDSRKFHWNEVMTDIILQHETGDYPTSDAKYVKYESIGLHSDQPHSCSCSRLSVQARIYHLFPLKNLARDTVTQSIQHAGIAK
jgi:hypothetical protein